MVEYNVLTGRKKELYDRAADERRRCIDWLRQFVIPGQPRALTKTELRAAALSELGISKNSFDSAWIAVIEETGRHDWYDPLPRRSYRLQ
jgi:hypothetical protein